MDKVTTAGSSSPKKKEKFEKYEIEEAVGTIRRAMDIKQKPRLMKLALAELKKQEKSTKEAVTWADNLV